MGRVVRDLGMTMLVGLVVYTLYAARSSRASGSSPEPSSHMFSTARLEPQVSAEMPPLGFTVFPWMP